VTDPFTNPDETSGSDPESLAAQAVNSSIVDTLLDLDALLSADVRRAEGIAYIYTRPDLEARLDALATEYEDAIERESLAGKDKAVGERTAATVHAEREKVRGEYTASRVPIRVLQLPSDDWDDFQHRHKAALQDAGDVFHLPAQVANELIAASMVAAQPVTVAQVAAMRTKFGWPQVSVIAARAWEVNRHSGVSVPK